MTFSVETDKIEEIGQIERGYFQGTPHDIQEEFDDLWELFDSGQTTPAEFQEQTSQLLAKCPEFIDIYVHKALLSLPPYTYHEPERIAAKRIYKKGVEIGLNVIPKGYKGLIEWSYHHNRPFLRAHAGLILSELYNENFSKALTMINKHLKWNPNDNQGMRYLKTGILVVQKKFDKARKELKGQSEYFASAFYSLAYLEFQSGHTALALSYLRQGIAGNPRIAEYLLGRKGRIFRGENSAFSEFALEEEGESYYFTFGKVLWPALSPQYHFLDWAFNSPEGLLDRADIAILDRAANTSDRQARSSASKKKSRLIQEMNELNSACWLRHLKERCPRLPWE
jgi:tetratricopeptide (TPR) repeat protein